MQTLLKGLCTSWDKWWLDLTFRIVVKIHLFYDSQKGTSTKRAGKIPEMTRLAHHSFKALKLKPSNGFPAIEQKMWRKKHWFFRNFRAGAVERLVEVGSFLEMAAQAARVLREKRKRWGIDYSYMVNVRLIVRSLKTKPNHGIFLHGQYSYMQNQQHEQVVCGILPYYICMARNANITR